MICECNPSRYFDIGMKNRFDPRLACFEPSHSNTSSNTDKNDHLDKLDTNNNSKGM